MSAIVLPLKVGDVVRLKSGGDLMTVEKIDGELVGCVWFQFAYSDEDSDGEGLNGTWVGPFAHDFMMTSLEEEA